jgi:Cytochrome C''.
MLHFAHNSKLHAATLALSLMLGASAQAAAPADAPANPAEMQKMMQQMMSIMTPELQKKIQSLSPQSKQTMARLQSLHDRRSDTLTMVQVMQEILSDYQRMATAIAVDNADMAIDAAHNLAHHRLPRGGLLPYMPLDKISNESVDALLGFQDMVEGNTLRLAEAAKEGNMAKAAGYLGPIAQGCVACHNHFRGQPGISPNVAPKK